MNELPAINEDTELLIHDKKYDIGNLIRQCRIIYCKYTGQFTLEYFDKFRDFAAPIQKQIMNRENVHLITCPEAFGNVVVCGPVHIAKEDEFDTFEAIVQLYNNGFQHPLVDEFEGVGVFK